jgi:hypothetical protein
MIRVKVDTKRIKPKIEKAVNMAQAVVDSELLKDSNKYAPRDTGNLVNSSLRASQIGKGKLIWDTPYARRLYYNPQYNFSKDKNPMAGGLWFERAKSVHSKKWTRIADQAIKRGL